MDNRTFTTLIDFLSQIPAINGKIGSGADESGKWWVKFNIDISHDLAWATVQELGHVLNYLSVDEHLPTSFHPVSPPPYLNGGPYDFLSWVIECSEPDFRPGTCAKWLKGRLPDPVNDIEEWITE